ncbi:pilus assembly protein PilW [Noviherbaspirillum sp. 17J57-3]|uniref:Pilus assembly protein PilW n=1 Tax=Noviherbaspirillum galbum TaxID=2709383 RepID=A0A6B3SPB5_9BURK|nr:pilus assembly protein PilW [Noviherbaspirillum galbum]
MTLVEVLVATAIGLLVTLASLSMLLGTRAGYLTGDEATRLDEAGRVALDQIARAIRQAGRPEWMADRPPFVTTVDMSPDVIGWDAHSVSATSPGIDAPLSRAVNGSDLLALRFFGAGGGTDGDGTVLNCAGFSKGRPASVDTADSERGWSVFYVAEDANGEPELYCKYQGRSAWSAQAIVGGVESFQVLYGLDLDGDGTPDQFVNAGAIRALDDGLPVAAGTAAEQAAARNRSTYWKKVVAVQFALLMRGGMPVRMDATDNDYMLFGPDYAATLGKTDTGTTIHESALPLKSRNRLRRVFRMTVQLRNHADGRQA